MTRETSAMLENNKTGRDKTAEMAIQGTNETKQLQDWNKFKYCLDKPKNCRKKPT